MKYKLPCLSSLWLIVGLSPLFAQTAPLAPEASGPAGAREAESTGRKSGDELIADARLAIAQHASIEAKVRQRVEGFGQRLVGYGHYAQHRDEEQILVHLLLKMQVAGQMSSLQQINDGRYLWTDEKLSDTRSVRRADLAEVRAFWAEKKARSARQATARLAAGGLAELLAAVSENFEFPTVSQSQLSTIPVYVLAGQWNSQQLIGLLPDQKKAIEAGNPPRLDKLPQHVPDELIVVLGRDDLFPYVFDFRRHIAPSETTAERIYTSLVQMEFFEVRIGGQIDLSQFVYKPGDVEVIDTTKALVGRLRARAGRGY